MLKVGDKAIVTGNGVRGDGLMIHHFIIGEKVIITGVFDDLGVYEAKLLRKRRAIKDADCVDKVARGKHLCKCQPAHKLRLEQKVSFCHVEKI